MINPSHSLRTSISLDPAIYQKVDDYHMEIGHTLIIWFFVADFYNETLSEWELVADHAGSSADSTIGI